MTYFYYISYDEKKDDFWGMVDSGDKTDCVFTIDSTEEIIFYIKNGVMNHIDDSEGLEKYLKMSGLIDHEDVLLLSEVTLY